MTIRLLATIEGVHCSVPLRDVLSNLITHTEYLPERHIYAAILTREQWNLIREQYWATGRMCEHGRIVPDIDFVADDGKVFTDFAECQKHEAYNPDPLTETATGLLIARQTVAQPSLMALIQSKLSVLAINGAQMVARFGRVKINLTPSDKYAIPFVEKFETILAKEIEDQVATLILYGIHPAFDEFTYRTQEENMPPWYSINFETQEVSRCQDAATLAERLNTPEKLDAEIERVTGQIEHLENVTKPAPTLAESLLVSVSTHYTSLSFLASLHKTTEEAVREAAESSGKFKFSGSGKSIAKLTA